MLSKEEALQLIEDKKLQDNVIAHSVQVNKISNYIAQNFKEKGYEIDLHLVDVGSLLHDIGRAIDHKKHDIIGTEMLKEIGEPEISNIIDKHRLFPNPELITWEEKIVYYSDKRVRHDQIVSLQERIEDILIRYPAGEIVNHFKPFLENIEKEIFDEIGWEHEPLEQVK